MRVVVVCVGSRGDVAPFVVLCRRLAEAAHDVVLIAPASLLPPAVPGVMVVPVESDVARLVDGPAMRAVRRVDVGGLNRERGAFADVLASVAQPLESVVAGADVVVASTFATAAVAVARRMGAPVLRAHLWPEVSAPGTATPVLPYSWILPRSGRRLLGRAAGFIEPLLAGFDGWWEGGKLYIVPHFDADFTTTDLGSLLAYSEVIAPVPPAGAPSVNRDHVTGWWSDPEPVGGLSAATVALLETPGEPWVYVGFGSMPQASGHRLLSLVDRMCLECGVRALVQLGGTHWPTRGIDTPTPRVQVIGPEPHAALFPRVAVVVHHGGSGTTGAAVRAAVPSVVVPHIADQFFWAHRLHTLGAAPRPIPRPILTSGRLGRRVRQALSPTMRRAAGRLAEQVALEDGAGEAVRLIETLVGAHD